MALQNQAAELTGKAGELLKFGKKIGLGWDGMCWYGDQRKNMSQTLKLGDYKV